MVWVLHAGVASHLGHFEKKKPLAAHVLIYPEARIPFDMPAATEK
jgi:hypothetical protein